MSETVRFGVIMAGGAGERFWPLSRAARPKQLLRLSSPDRSMLEEAVERLLPLIPAERVHVITGRALVAPIREANIGIPAENVVAEPAKRNTSGALAWITAHILASHPHLAPERVSLAIVTADHRIGAPDQFRAMIVTALGAAERQGTLAVCGIAPTHAETGFGYIQTAGPADSGGVHPVRAFHEKPNRERAEEFLASGGYYWNGGMFFWTAGAFLKELDHARPALSEAVRVMAAALHTGDAPAAEAAFLALDDISIDYALMERARCVVMAPAAFPWIDIGSWPALDEVLPRDEGRNATQGAPVLLNCEDCIVLSEPGAERMVVAAAGLRDVVIAVTGDAVLVIPKARAQDVKHLVAEIKKRGLPQV